MGAAFDTLVEIGILDNELARSMKKAVDLRNIAVHNYQAIDWEIVHAICCDNLEDFRAFAEATLRVQW